MTYRIEVIRLADNRYEERLDSIEIDVDAEGLDRDEKNNVGDRIADIIEADL